MIFHNLQFKLEKTTKIVIQTHLQKWYIDSTNKVRLIIHL